MLIKYITGRLTRGDAGCSAVTSIKINRLCINRFTFTPFGQSNVERWDVN